MIHKKLRCLFWLCSQCILLAGLFLLSACGGGGSSGEPEEEVTAIEQQLNEALSTLATDTDFTLLVESANGAQFSYSSGDSSADTPYRSASSSKMVTASVILQLVADGIMQLDDQPQDYLGYWPTTGRAASIELHQLLSFSSGLVNEPFCINNPYADFHSCVAKIIDENPDMPAPGSAFYYSGTHLQVAAAMAVSATGLSSWTEVFAYFQTQTRLFENAVYDLPSATNPRVAGGMHWQATEFVAYLGALFHRTILSNELIDAATSDKVQGLPITYSPVASGPLALDWHYGFGMWIECDNVPFDCSDTTRVSSAGAYGAYPFIDFANGYFGIVAREGPLGTGHEGYSIWASVKPLLSQWAASQQ